MLLPVAFAEARITKIQITTKEAPTFGGYSWPDVGQYAALAASQQPSKGDRLHWRL